MLGPYQPEIWYNLYIMLGTAASALVGLLFVVMTLHLGPMQADPSQTMQATLHGARNNTYHLVTLMIVSALVLVPQPPLTLGLAIAWLNLFSLRLPIGFTRRWIGRDLKVTERNSFPYAVIITITLGYSLGVAGGIGIAMDRNWGMYAVSAGAVIVLVRTVLTARELLFGRPALPQDS